MKNRKAVTWYEYWAEKYNETLNITWLNTSRWGKKTLAQFFGYFRAYEDKPEITARIEAKRLWIHCYHDMFGARLTEEQYHKKAMARLQKIERKLVEWENEF